MSPSRFSCALVLTLAASTAVQALDAPSKENGAPVPVIKLDAELTDRNPSAFAKRLGEVMGAEVRLPAKGFKKLSVPAGEWTATQLLNHVARQFEDASWQHVFELRALVKGRSGSTNRQPKLVPTGRITTLALDLSFPQVVRIVEESAPCVIRLPDGTPPGRYRARWADAPLDRVLSDLATAGNLRVTEVIVFRQAVEAQTESDREQEERVNLETQQQGEIANRLEELYGFDPHGDEFPWETIDRDAVASSLGRELGLDPTLADVLMERIRLEGSTRRSE